MLPKPKRIVGAKDSIALKPRPAYGMWTCLLLIIAFVIVVRVRLLEIPLERDEGEYAYAGQLIRQGIPPYELVYNIKLPGTYVAYALIMTVFGETTVGIHLGLLVINIAAILLLFFFVKRLIDAPAAVMAGATYALMSISPSVLGFAGHATQFVVVAALGGLLLLLRALESGRLLTLFWSAFLFGTAFLLKQPGILFGVFGGLYLLLKKNPANQTSRVYQLKKLTVFFFGTITPYGLTCLILWQAGVFEKFWRWTITYAGGHSAPWSLGLQALFDYFQSIVGPDLIFWWLAAGALLFLPWTKEIARSKFFFIVGFLLASFLAVCPGLYFSEHYFVLMLPALSLAIGAGAGAARQMLKSRMGRAIAFLPAGIFIAACGFVIVSERVYLFQMPPSQISSAIYGLNPFHEAIEVADYIQRNSQPDSRVAVLGSEPEIYFYAHRHSATGYIYGYDLMLHHKYALDMQREMIREIEAVRPEYIVLVNNLQSWTVWPKSDKIIFKWGNKYTEKFYDLVGTVDQLESGQTIYHWDNDAVKYPVKSNYFILVYKRKPAQ